MRRALIVLAIWASGVLSAGVGLELAGGWWEYHAFTQAELASGGWQMAVNRWGYELVPGLDSGTLMYYDRRPRVLGWLRGGP